MTRRGDGALDEVAVTLGRIREVEGLPVDAVVNRRRVATHPGGERRDAIRTGFGQRHGAALGCRWEDQEGRGRKEVVEDLASRSGRLRDEPVLYDVGWRLIRR